MFDVEVEFVFQGCLVRCLETELVKGRCHKKLKVYAAQDESGLIPKVDE